MERGAKAPFFLAQKMYLFFPRLSEMNLRMSGVSCNVLDVASRGWHRKGFQMSGNKEICYDCEVELNKENTIDFGGFDASNYLASRGFGNGPEKDSFTKCDSCYEADIDRHLDNQ
jgi:hypothetical protein